MAPGATDAATATGRLRRICRLLLYIDSDGLYRRVCGIGRLQKHEKMIRHVPTWYR